MSDEVRSNSSPAPPDAGAKASDSGEGPRSLDIEFPAPDVEPESTPDSWPLPNAAPRVAVAVLPNRDIASLPPMSIEAESIVPESIEPGSSIEPGVTLEASGRSDRPPPSQRPRVDAGVTPVPPSPAGATIPVGAHTLPAPAPLVQVSMPEIPAAAPLFPAPEVDETEEEATPLPVGGE
jgi:hypothetical protein